MTIREYRVELILDAFLLAVSVGVSTFQATNTLTKAEVDRYMVVLEKAVPVEWEERNELLVRTRRGKRQSKSVERTARIELSQRQLT